jgi:hypothetical protein
MLVINLLNEGGSGSISLNQFHRVIGALLEVTGARQPRSSQISWSIAFPGNDCFHNGYGAE